MSAEAPAGSILTPASSIGSRVTLVQKQGFKKNSADAKLRLHVTKVLIEAIAANGQEIVYPECPWRLDCGLVISGKLAFDVRAYRINTIFSGRSTAELFGRLTGWAASRRPSTRARRCGQAMPSRSTTTSAASARSSTRLSS